MFTDKVKVGDILDDLIFQVLPGYNEQILKSVHCINPLYKTKIHPALLIGKSNITQSPSFKLEDNVAAIHVQDEIEFLKSAKVGNTIKVSWVITDIFHRRDRYWKDVEYQIAEAVIMVGSDVILKRRMTDYFTRGENV